MSFTCRAVRLQLPAMNDPSHFEGPLAGHVSTCLRCQAEVSRYRKLSRSLGILADEVVVAPATLTAAVEERIAEGGASRAEVLGRASRVAAAAGAVVAAAGTVVMVRWIRTRSAA